MPEFNWPTKIRKFGITCPFQKVLVTKYEGIIDWNGGRITDAAALDEHIREKMLPDLARKLDPDDKKSHYCRRINLASVLENPAQHFDEVRAIRDREGEDAARVFLLDRINRQKKEGFEAWWNYLTEDNPLYKETPAFQYLTLRPAVESSNARCTRQPFPLDAEAVAYVFDGIQGGNIEPDANLLRAIAEFTAFGARDGGDRPEFGTACGWVVVTRDMSNASNRVASLSQGCGWCVASASMASLYLTKSDFHLLVENGRAVVAVRTAKNKAVEIQGQDNGPPGLWWPRILLYLEARAFTISHRSGEANTAIAGYRRQLADLDTPRRLADHLKEHPAQVRFVDEELAYDENFRPVIEAAWMACVQADPLTTGCAPKWIVWEKEHVSLLIKSWRTWLATNPRSIVLIPKFLSQGPEFAKEHIDLWVSALRSDPSLIDRCPDLLRILPEITDALWAGRIRLISENRHNPQPSVLERFWKDCPAHIRGSEEVRATFGDAWCSRLKKAPEDWNLCPDELKILAAVTDARRKGWINEIHNYRPNELEVFWDCLPEEIQLHPKVVDAWQERWLDLIREDVYVQSKCPEAVRALPELPKAILSGWIKLLRTDLRSWDNCPKKLRGDPQVKKVITDGWIEKLETTPTAWDNCPEECRSEPSVMNARVAGWSSKLESNPSAWDDCPEECRSEPSVMHARVEGWTSNLWRNPTAWDDCPEECRSEPSVLDARIAGWIRKLETNPKSWSECPPNLRSDPLLVEARLTGGLIKTARKLKTQETRIVRVAIETLAGRPARYVDRRGESIRFNYGTMPVNVNALRRIGCEIRTVSGTTYVWVGPEVINTIRRDNELSHQATIAARASSMIQDWIRCLSANPDNWRQCPDSVLNEALVVEVLTNRYHELIATDPAAFERCPPFLQNDPEMRTARATSWQNLLKKRPGAINDCPKDLRASSEIIKAVERGWLDKLKANPLNWSGCPEKLRLLPDYADARKEGWLAYLQEDPTLWNDCPAALRGEPGMSEARRNGWVDILKADPTAYSECPDHLRRDDEIRGAMISGYSTLLSQNPDGVTDLPPEAMANQKLASQFRQYWEDRLGRAPNDLSKLPPSIRDHVEVPANVIKWLKSPHKTKHFDWSDWINLPRSATSDDTIARRAVSPIIRALRRNPRIWSDIPAPWREMEELRQEAARNWACSPSCEGILPPEDIRDLVEGNA